MKSFKDIIKKGGVAVIKTDTLYGLVCDAFNQHAVARIYDIKKRNPLKPVIVLISSISDIENFGIKVNSELHKKLSAIWPDKVSVILPSDDNSVNTHHIHKGTGGIAFRMPADKELRSILAEVGPLVAPSANPEGLSPAINIQQATDYFGDDVDFYMDGGEVTNTRPSKIIKIIHNIEEVIVRA